MSKPIKCPHCGARLRFASIATTKRCPFCGASIPTARDPRGPAHPSAARRAPSGDARTALSVAGSILFGLLLLVAVITSISLQPSRTTVENVSFSEVQTMSAQGPIITMLPKAARAPVDEADALWLVLRSQVRKYVLGSRK